MRIDHNINHISEEDAKAMEAILKVPSDEQYWQRQQSKQRPKFKSASMTQNGNPHINHRCEKCGCNSHHVGECPYHTWNVLVPSS